MGGAQTKKERIKKKPSSSSASGPSLEDILSGNLNNIKKEETELTIPPPEIDLKSFQGSFFQHLTKDVFSYLWRFVSIETLCRTATVCKTWKALLWVRDVINLSHVEFRGRPLSEYHDGIPFSALRNWTASNKVKALYNLNCTQVGEKGFNDISRTCPDLLHLHCLRASQLSELVCFKSFKNLNLLHLYDLVTPAQSFGELMNWCPQLEHLLILGDAVGYRDPYIQNFKHPNMKSFSIRFEYWPSCISFPKLEELNLFLLHPVQQGDIMFENECHKNPNSAQDEGPWPTWYKTRNLPSLKAINLLPYWIGQKSKEVGWLGKLGHPWKWHPNKKWDRYTDIENWKEDPLTKL